MHYHYSTVSRTASAPDRLPILPLGLMYGDKRVETAGLVDSGSTINVMPYQLGLDLGADWDNLKAVIRLAGSLANHAAIPLIVTAQVAQYDAVRLAFAWTQSDSVPLILGQMNFFEEFSVCFYRHRDEFDVTPKPATQ